MNSLLLINEMTGWSETISRKFQVWWIEGGNLLPNILVAVFFCLLFILLARPFRRLIFKISLHISKSEAIGKLFSNMAYFLIIALGLYIGLNILSLDKIAISLLASAGIIGLTLAFAFQDLTANFISGVYIDFNKPFEIGDIIESGNIKGEVENIGLRSTLIYTPEGLYILVPNKNIFQSPIINYSKSRKRMITIKFMISIQEGLENIEQVILQSVKPLSGIIHHRKARCYFTDMDQKNIQVTVSFWIHQFKPYENLRIRHDAILAILKGLKTNNIQMLKT